MTKEAIPVSIPCNICGSTEFAPGPSGRLSPTQRLPSCASCHSLERHRAVRAAFDALPSSLFQGTRCLQFSPDPALDRAKFGEIMVSIWGGENSLDMQDIALPDASFDWIYSSHVVNHIPNTAVALREMLRVVGKGCIVFNVGGTAVNYVTRDSEQYCGPDRQFRVYGMQYAHEIQSALPEVAVLEIVALDPCSLMLDSVYFASLDQERLQQMAAAAANHNVHTHVFPALKLKAAAAPISRGAQNAWAALRDEITALRDELGSADFWVRDDDATQPSQRLIDLIELCGTEEIPLAMAVIPLPMTLNLVELISRHSHVTPIQHGFDHQNRETNAEKPKSEFPDDRALNDAVRSIQLGWHVMNEAFGTRVLPVFCPPWGTLATAVRDRLPDLGFTGLSASRIAREIHRRGKEPAALTHASAHVAVNKRTRVDSPPLDEQRILETLATTISEIRKDRSNEPVGIMTHHWGVDGEVRDFLRRLFQATRAAGATWRSADTLFMTNAKPDAQGVELSNAS